MAKSKKPTAKVHTPIPAETTESEDVSSSPEVVNSEASGTSVGDGSSEKREVRFQPPGAPRPPTGNLSNSMIWLYGPPKIGKTTFASQFPGVWFIATEKGHDWLSTREPTLIGSWEEFLEWCGYVEEHKPTHFSDGEPIKTICIDVIDLLFNMCKDYVCGELGVGDLSELEFGKGWARLSNEFQRVITKIRRWPYGLVCISHCRDKEQTMRGRKTNKTEPDVGAGALRVLAGMSDLILYCYADEHAETVNGELTGKIIETRRIRCHPASDCVSGGRMAKLLPPSMELDYNTLISEMSKDAKKPKK